MVRSLSAAVGDKMGHVGNGYRAPSLFERFGTSTALVIRYPAIRACSRIVRLPSMPELIDPVQELSAGFGDLLLHRVAEVIIFDFSGLINPATDPSAASRL